MFLSSNVKVFDLFTLGIVKFNNNKNTPHISWCYGVQNLKSEIRSFFTGTYNTATTSGDACSNYVFVVIFKEKK